MSLNYDYVDQAPHRCNPPSDGFPGHTYDPEGTRFFCDCGLVWIVRRVPAQSLGTQRVLPYSSWFRESRRERRRRLRIRWWQRA